MPAGKLWKGAHVRDEQGGYGVVQKIAYSHHAAVMYNLTVSIAHTYYAGAGRWLVHNACGGGNVTRLFSKYGTRLTKHAVQRLQERGSRGVTVRAVINAYSRGRLYYDTKYKSYIRCDNHTGVAVAVSRPSRGTILSVFEGRPSGRWRPVPWRSG